MDPVCPRVLVRLGSGLELGPGLRLALVKNYNLQRKFCQPFSRTIPQHDLFPQLGPTAGLEHFRPISGKIWRYIDNNPPDRNFISSRYSREISCVQQGVVPRKLQIKKR